MNDVLLHISNLSHAYGKTPVLRDVSFELKKGSIGCLLGPSGSGKTTLLRCIAGFEQPATGCIRIDERVVQDATQYVPPWQRGVGIVFQEHALFPHLTVAENVAFGLTGRTSAEKEKRVEAMLDAVELQGFAARFPHELSGGQQQRVALARALAPNPTLLLLDEPFSSLDSALRQRMKTELRGLLRKLSVTALMITHATDEAFDVADTIGVMGEQRILQWGEREQLYRYPNHPDVAATLGLANILPVTMHEQRCIGPWGELSYDFSGTAASGMWISRPDDFNIAADAMVQGILREIRFRGDHRYLRVDIAGTTSSSNSIWIQDTLALNEHLAEGATIGIQCKGRKAWILSDSYR